MHAASAPASSELCTLKGLQTCLSWDSSMRTHNPIPIQVLQLLQQVLKAQPDPEGVENASLDFAMTALQQGVESASFDFVMTRVRAGDGCA
eukprot:1159612-Pelagomonas_calceolata.AAC.10